MRRISAAASLPAAEHPKGRPCLTHARSCTPVQQGEERKKWTRAWKGVWVVVVVVVVMVGVCVWVGADPSQSRG